jgi:hypothetical protein
MTLLSQCDAPEGLWSYGGNCGLLAAWVAIKHYHRRTCSYRLTRMCGYTKRHGVFTIGLAVALREHGLDVQFHSDPDPDMKPIEGRFYSKARGLKIPILPAVSLGTLLQHIEGGHLPIVFFDTPEGDGHFSPLVGQKRGALLLPHVESGRMSRRTFLRRWSAPAILRQCVVVTGRTAAT